MSTYRLSRNLLAILSIVILVFTVACGKSSATAPSGCQIITGVTTTSFPASGGTASISVTTPNACTWTATSNAAFLTVSEGASGAGNGTVKFAVAANTGAVRTATLTITGTAIVITQAGQ
jgi:hypothetical protein